MPESKQGDKPAATGDKGGVDKNGPPQPKLSDKQKVTILRAFKQMAKKEGLGSFYKGLGMALIGTIASFGCYFFCYRLIKNVIMHTLNLKETELNSKHIMLVTALSGSVSSVFANPFWLLNTRMTLAKGKQSML